jgi:signal transduction histidine kinase/CheY-like chemotaxis protein
MDYNIRSRIENKNEFGTLSSSLNALMESIQTNIELSKKTAILSEKMMSEKLARSFFQKILPALSENTNSQMAAVYILSEDKKQFEHYESVGLADESRLSFDVNNFQGEFGPVMATRKIQFVKRIPIDTRFVFQTVSGKFIPREIVTIPIISGSEVIAIISLASVRTYSEDAIALIENILDTLNARVEGVMAYRKMRKFSELLEEQNAELEAQKTELHFQSMELKEQNAELEMQKNQLTEVSRLKTNFLSNMSHELRTPLNSVIALSGVLSRKLSNKIPADEYSYIEVIERNGRHLLTLINEILDISRIEAGHEEIDISEFNVNDIVAGTVELIHPQARKKKIKLYHLDTENKIIVSGDSQKYKHILQNLIGNAVKFTEKGKVDVIVQDAGEYIDILVTDTGIGMTDNEQQHIFDEFRQADGSTSRRFGGTGLGLAIAKKYTNLLGGTISVKSEPGAGSVFKLTMPKKYDQKNRIHITTGPIVNSTPISGNINANQNQDSQKTLLLVEDSEPAIIQMKDFLEESGYRIITAHNGAQALEIIDLIIPDAMILDLMMPGVDGFEVLKNLRAVDKTAHIPVLVLTAKHITQEDLKELKQNNVYQLIQKGDIKRTDLLHSVAKMTNTEIVEVEPEKLVQEKRVIEGKPCVLIVEDNPDNMITIKAILGDDYTIIEAIDGLEGVSMAKKYKPDFVLMDIELPKIDGVEAFKSIRQIDELAYIPIIALTASAMSTDKETLLAHGFDGYLAKPIEESVLFSTIDRVLYGKK